MTLPLVLPISMSDMETEFSAPPGTPMSEFLKGGTYVPDNSENVNVPTELPISVTDFFGAAATPGTALFIAQDPTNAEFALAEIDAGAYTCVEHSSLFSTTQDPDEEFVIRLRVKCGTGQVDGGDLSPQLPGYSWARQRLSLGVGIHLANGRFVGTLIDFYFTSATTGYIRVGQDSLVSTASPGSSDQIQGSRYQDQPNTDYGNFVIPSDQDYVELKVTRGESYTQNTGTGSTRYTSDWNLYINQRDDFGTEWKHIPVAYGGNATLGGDWNPGGVLSIINTRYENDALCDLDINAIEAFIGGTDFP